jgi:hypothetical protein
MTALSDGPKANLEQALCSENSAPRFDRFPIYCHMFEHPARSTRSGWPTSDHNHRVELLDRIDHLFDDVFSEGASNEAPPGEHLP